MGDKFTSLFEEPYRPKRMRMATYLKYAAREAELDARDNRDWEGMLEALRADPFETLAS